MTMTVLIVEDRAEIRELLRLNVEGLGYHSIEASTLGDAIAVLDENTPPDLILLDLRLPDDEGWALFEHMKLTADGRRIPVIVISAFAGASELEQSLALGCHAYLKKPFARAALIASVESALNPQP